MIASTMQDDFPLTITAIMEHGSRVHGSSECVTWEGDHARRADFATVAANAGRLAHALRELDVEIGDRVATFCWNHQEHLETYYAVPCMGAVLHTVNIRLPAQQIAAIINHAEDKVILVDASLVPLLAQVADQLDTVRTVIVIGDVDANAFPGKDVRNYADLLAAQPAEFPWPELDERTPAAMCYTSGTTGEPRGVVYSHRSAFLHSLAGISTVVSPSTDSDRSLLIVPMFHVNGWGIPYGAFLSGSSLLLPGRYMQSGPLTDFIAAERPTQAAGVPTIWQGILEYGETHPIDLSSLQLGGSGGAAAPRALLEAFEQRYGVRIIQGWGMTETSPLGGKAFPPAGVELGTAEEMDWRLKSGRIAPGVQMRVVDDTGRELPWDGTSPGEIEVRGPWIAAGYHRDPAPERFHDGWLRTGDVGTIDERGYFQITDRVKDLIKSGGEWISSVELENQLANNPDVLEAAVVGIPDEKWTERPLACVVPRPGAKPDPKQLAEYLTGKVARWQVPENWAFLDEVPKTSVGKYDKKQLRGRYRAGELNVTRLD